MKRTFKRRSGAWQPIRHAPVFPVLQRYRWLPKAVQSLLQPSRVSCESVLWDANEIVVHREERDTAKSGSFIEAAGSANDIVREDIMPQNQPFEIPQQLRELAERNVEQARTAYGQLMDAMAQATGMWMSAMPSNEMTSGFKVVRERAIQFAKQNAEACFAAASELANAKDIQDLLAIQSRSAQTQMQAYALQAQELGRLMVEAAQSVQPRSWSRRPLDAFNVPVIDQLLVWPLTRAASQLWGGAVPMRKRTGLLKRIEKIEQQRSPRRPVFVWRELDETAEAESGRPASAKEIKVLENAWDEGTQLRLVHLSFMLRLRSVRRRN
jgi:hypothetical protein